MHKPIGLVLIAGMIASKHDTNISVSIMSITKIASAKITSAKIMIFLSATVLYSCSNITFSPNESDQAYPLVSQSEINKERGLGTDCNPNDTQADLPNPVNIGTLDDRSCKHDYQETSFDGNDARWGKYEISENSSTDASNSTRMERKFTPRLKPNNTGFHRFTGLFRIEDVDDHKGTYFIQGKGKHVGSKGDPALALFQAKKRDLDGEMVFDIYREEITKRDGKFSNGGRRSVFLTSVKQHETFYVEMITGFKVGARGIEQHYVNVRIKDTWYNFEVPEPQMALETGIRYGAYVVRDGNAKIYVSNTQFERG